MKTCPRFWLVYLILLSSSFTLQYFVTTALPYTRQITLSRVYV